MSMWTDLVQWFGGGRKSITLRELALDLLSTRRAKSGVTVNWQTALDVTTVLACARVIGEGISQVPLRLYRDDGRSRLPETGHPLYNVLYRRPNRWQTSFEYRETLALHLVLCGNHYSFRNRAIGAVQELIPLEPGWVVVERAQDGSPGAYRVTLPNGSSETFPPEAIWHIRGPSWNGYLGLDAVALAREAIGLAMATETAHATLHRNGLRTSGVLAVEGVLKAEQYEQLYAFLQRYVGGDNQGAPLILDRNAKWTRQEMTGVDAQHLETRRFQVEEICRALRVMPIMVGYSDKASTYASAEQMFLAHVVHTLSPWYERIEQSIDVNLLSEQDREDGIYSAFEEEELLRSSSEATKNILLGYVNGGLMTPNEGRAKLDLNPLEGGDELRIPANITGAAGASSAATATPAPVE